MEKQGKWRSNEVEKQPTKWRSGKRRPKFSTYEVEKRRSGTGFFPPTKWRKIGYGESHLCRTYSLGVYSGTISFSLCMMAGTLLAWVNLSNSSIFSQKS